MIGMDSWHLIMLKLSIYLIKVVKVFIIVR